MQRFGAATAAAAPASAATGPGTASAPAGPAGAAAAASASASAATTTWVFEVPASAAGVPAGPPLAVLSAQPVRLCGEHTEACRLSCAHLPKLAFRLDPNKR